MENGKKDPCRYTIRFQGHLPEHQYVMDILDAQGRRKAEYIVKAILHYSNSAESCLTAIMGENLENYIRQLLREELLPSLAVNNAVAPDTANGGVKPCEAVSHVQEPANDVNDLLAGFSDDDKRGIAADVASFRRRRNPKHK